MSFHLRGELPDLHSLFLNPVDYSLGALAPSEVVLIPHRVMIEVMQQCPELGRLLWRDTLKDAAVFREWMIGIGRRTAYPRVAHLLCELVVRIKALGLQYGLRYDLPIT
jgi:hypothetical protein